MTHQWVRAWKPDQRCGGCLAAISVGTPMVEWKATGLSTETPKARCASCAKKIFNEDPPETIADEPVRGPAPSLLVDTVRQPDFITTAQLARRNQYVGYRQRRGSR